MQGKKPPRKSIYLLGKSARFVSMRLLPVACKAKAKPNQITFLSLIFAIFSALFYSPGKVFFNVFGLLFFLLFFIFDHLDGDLARYLGLDSILGDLFDSLTGKIGFTVIIMGICFGQDKLHNPTFIWFLGFIIISGIFAFQSLFFKYQLIKNKNNITQTQSNLGNQEHKRKNVIIAIFKEFTSGYMILGHLIIFGSIFNKLYYTLIIFAVYVWIYYFYEISCTVKNLSKVLNMKGSK